MLDALLRLLHPIIPFVTEEIWHNVAPRLGIVGNSISTQAYPEAGQIDSQASSAEADVEWLKSVVSQLRRIRSELNLAGQVDLTTAGKWPRRGSLAGGEVRFTASLPGQDRFDRLA